LILKKILFSLLYPVTTFVEIASFSVFPSEEKAMANTTVSIYIRNKSGLRKTGKRLTDLPETETYMLYWYEGTKRKAKAIGRFADAARVCLINKEAQLKHSALAGIAPTPEPEMPTTSGRDFLAAVKLYLSEVKRGKSKKTHLAYSIALDGFSKVCKAQTIEAMTRDDVLKYTDLLRDSGLAPRTIANRLAFLKTFFKHFNLAWPMLKTDRVRFTEKTVEAYSLEDLQSLFDACNQEEFELFRFLLGTGVREQEAMYATWRDVDFHNKLFKVTEKLDLGFRPKDKEEASVSIPDSLVTLLEQRRKKYPNTRLIFPLPDGKPNGHMLRTLQRRAFRSGLNCGGCYNRAGQCCKDKAMCHYWGLHRFRKTFATMHHHEGEVSVRTIQRWLRHSSLDTTLRYLAGSDDKSAKTREKVNNSFAGLRQTRFISA
jgi:integrase/recombinase XerD